MPTNNHVLSLHPILMKYQPSKYLHTHKSYRRRPFAWLQIEKKNQMRFEDKEKDENIQTY